MMNFEMFWAQIAIAVLCWIISECGGEATGPEGETLPLLDLLFFDKKLDA